VVWDLRYAHSSDDLPMGDDDDTAGSPGPVVTPGLYKVRLVTSMGSMEEPLKVILDPRSVATPAALAQQFDWAKRAFQDIVTAQKLKADANATKQTEFQKQLDAALGGLSAALAAMESADRAPTSQAITLYQQSSAALKTLQRQRAATAGR
jgi:hypothetical protein